MSSKKEENKKHKEQKKCDECKKCKDCKIYIRPLQDQILTAAKKLESANKHTTAALRLLGIKESCCGPYAPHFNIALLSVTNRVIRAKDNIVDAQAQLLATKRLLDCLLDGPPLTKSNLPSLLLLDKQVDDVLAKTAPAQDLLHLSYYDLCSLMHTCEGRDSKKLRAVLRQIFLADRQLPIVLTGDVIRLSVGCLTGCLVLDADNLSDLGFGSDDEDSDDHKD